MAEFKYNPSNDDMDRDENNFNYHPCKDDQAERYQDNRVRCMALAASLRRNCPPSRELSLALTKLEEVMFWGNAAIARHE